MRNALLLVLAALLLLGLAPRAGEAAPAAGAPRPFHEREAERLLRELEARPHGAAAFANLIRLWEQREHLPDPDSLRARLARLAARPGLPPLLASWVQFYLAAAEERVGLLAEARQRLSRLGFPPDWRVVGPFEDLGGSGFDEPHPPEAEARQGTSPGATYRGVEGEVRWRTLPGLGALGRIDLAPLFSRSDDVLAYLAVAVHLEQPQDVVLRLGSSDGLKVFVDGVVRHSRPVRRSAAFDQEALPLRLTAGWHRLLFKVARDEGSWTLFCRLTAPDGSPLPGLSFATDPARFAGRLDGPPPAEVAAPVREPIAMAREELERLRRTARPAAAKVAEQLGVLGLLESRCGPGDRREGRAAALFREAVALDPGSAALQLELGLALQDDENACRTAFEAAQALDPHSVPVLEALAGYHHDRADVPRAWRADEALLAVDPGNIQARIRRASRWNELEQPEHALALLRELHQLHPASPAVAEALGEQHARMGDPARALGLFRQALEQEHLRFPLRSRVISLLAGKGEVDGMLEQVRTVLDVWPHSLAYHLQLTHILAENGRQAEAIEHLQRLTASFPDHPLLHEKLGRLLLLSGAGEQGLASLRTALQLRPQDQELRRYLRRLTPGEQTLEQRFALPVARLRSTPPPPGTQEMGAYRPLLLRAVEVHPNGMRTSFTQLTLVVTDPQRLEEFQSVPIFYTPGEEVLELLTAERITRDGEVFRPTLVFTTQPRGKQGGMYIDTATRVVQFSDLQAGDLVHLRYRQDEVGSRNMFGDFFGDIVHLQERVPLARLSYVLDAPADRPLSSGGRGAGEPEVQEVGGRRIHRWEWRDLPPLRQEPGMPGYPEVGRYLNVSTYSSWQELARWYSDLIRPQFVLEAEDVALVHRIVAGKTDELDKIRAIHAWVLHNTRYVGIEFGIHGFKPYPASRILRRGYGDCKDKASLIVTMLAELGIEARLVLIRTLSRGRLLSLPPTLWAFNHAIVYIPGHDLWLDGTAEYSGLSELPYNDQGAMALVLDHRAGTGELVETPVFPARANHWSTRVQGTFTDDLTLRLEVREQVTGQGASRVRREYQDPSLRRSKLEKSLASRFPGIRVLKAEVERISSLDEPPVLSFAALLPHVLRRQGEGLVLPLAIFPSQLATHLASASTREHERVLDYPWSEEGEVRLELPDGWRLAEQPPEARASSRFGEYWARAEQTAAGEVVLTSGFALTQRRISPEEYPEFRKFLLEIDQIESRLLPLARSGGPDAVREARR